MEIEWINLIGGGMGGLVGGTVAGFIARSYIGSYLSKKGEMLARKEDIEHLRREVRVLTKEAETIKAEIGHDVWGKQRRWEKKWELSKQILEELDSRLV